MEEENSPTVPQEPDVNVPPSVEETHEGPSQKPDLETSLKGLFDIKEDNEESNPEPSRKTEEEEDKLESKSVKPPEKKGEEKKTAAKPRGKPDDPRNTEDPKNLSQKGRDGWKVLKEQAGKWYETAQTQTKEIEQLKAELANRGKMTTEEVEKYKKQVEELAPFRTMIDIHADPEFVKEYDQPLEKTREDLAKILRGAKVPDDAIENLNFTDTKAMDTIIDALREKVDKLTARKFEGKVEEFIRNHEKREEVLGKWKSDHKSFIESRKKSAFAKDAEREGIMLSRLQQITDHKDESGSPLVPFLVAKEIHEGASQGEIAEINRHNESAEKFRAQIDEVIKSKDPSVIADTAVAAISAHWFKAQLEEAKKQNAVLEANLKKVSVAGTEREPGTKPTLPSGNRPRSTSLEDAAKDYFGQSVEVY